MDDCSLAIYLLLITSSSKRPQKVKVHVNVRGLDFQGSVDGQLGVFIVLEVGLWSLDHE